jgi:hypothetical protein
MLKSNTAPSEVEPRMRIFRAESEAKEYLIQRIVAQARRDGEALTDVERKMLYFSETGWTLPGIMEANAEFERTCDEAAYERKILALAINAQADATADGDAASDWRAAVDKLSGGDHYLLVLIDPRLASPPQSKRPRLDFFRLVFTACAVVVCGLLLFGLVDEIRQRFHF